MPVDTLTVDTLDRLREGGRRVAAVSAVADALGVHRATVYRWIERGELPALAIGGRRLVLLDGLEDMLANSLRGTSDRSAVDEMNDAMTARWTPD